MARGRMIDNCISISEKINDLSLKEAFIYTWIIPHLDDWGRISGSPRTLKALIFPMKKEITVNDIEKSLIKFKQIGLFLWEEVNEVMVLQQPFDEFNSHQSISDKKRAKSKYPEVIEESPRIPKNPQENPAQDKIREDKLREENIGQRIPHKEIVEFYNTTCLELPKVAELTPNRIKTIETRWNKYATKKDKEGNEAGIGIFQELFERANESDLLSGRIEDKRGYKKQWKASFDWLLNENNMVKVLEGNYENPERSKF